MISAATKRSALRWIHIIFAIPILGYIYSPFEEIPKYAPTTRFVFVPAIMLAGYWMWRGYVFAIIGVVAGQQRKIDARSQVPVGFGDESQEVRVVLLIPACDVQVAKM